MSGLQLPLISNQAESARQSDAVPMVTWDKFQLPKDDEVSNQPKTSEDPPDAAKQKAEDAADVKQPWSSFACTCACSFKLGVIVGLDDGSVIFVGPKTEDVLKKHDKKVNALSAAEDIVASGSEDNTVTIWNFETRRFVTIHGHTHPVTCVSVLPGGKFVVSGSRDGKVKAWSVAEVSNVANFEGHTGSVTCVSFMKSGNLIVSGSTDKTIKIWNCYSWKLAGIAGTLENKGEVTCLAVMPGDECIVSGDDHGYVRIWKWFDYSLGYGGWGQLFEVPNSHTDSVTCLVIAETSDGQYIFSGSADSTIKLYEFDYLEEGITLSGHTEKVTCLALLSDGKHVASGSDDKTVRIWSLEESKEVAKPIEQTTKVTCLATRPQTNDIVLGLSKGINCITDLALRVPTLRTAGSSYKDYDLRILDGFLETLKPNETADFDAEKLIHLYNINILHLYAYAKDLPNLQENLKTAAIIRGVFGSPLTIALKQKSTKCVDAILGHLSSNSEKEDYFLAIQAVTADFLVLLTFKNLHQLVPFFNTLLRASTTQKVPEVFAPKHALPYAVFRTRRLIHISDFTNPKGTEEDKEEIEFLVSVFSWNFAQGSAELLNLMRALENSEDRKILTTPVVTHLVQSKWEKFLLPARLHATLYLCLLLCLIGIKFDWDIGTFVIVIFVSLNAFFLRIELAKSAKKGKPYLNDVWYYVHVFGCIASIVCLAQAEEKQGFLSLMASACFFRGIVSYKPSDEKNPRNVPLWIQYIDNGLYLCLLLDLIGTTFNYLSFGVLSIFLISLNAIVLFVTSLVLLVCGLVWNHGKTFAALLVRGRVWNHGKTFACVVSIAWGCLMLYEAKNLQYLNFIMLCLCSLGCVACFRRGSKNVYISYICLILCLIEMSFNYWDFTFLGIVFISLNALFLLCHLALLYERQPNYLSDVRSYVDGIVNIVGMTWGCLVCFEAKQSLYSQFAVICMFCLYAYSILRNNSTTSHLLLYSCSLSCLLGMAFNYWSLGILEIVYISMNAGFLFIEIVKVVNDTDYWKDGWNYVQLLQCLTGITWGWLVFFDVENLQYFQLAVMCLSLLRGFAVFRTYKMHTRSYIRRALYICLLLCLVGITLNWNLGTLEPIFLCLSGLLLTYEVVEMWRKGAAYWTNAWNYVTLLQCVASSACGCLLYYEVEHLQYLYLVVLTLCVLRSFTFFHHISDIDEQGRIYLLYLFSLLYLIEITSHNWSLGVIFIWVNALFLLYETVKSIPDLRSYWTDVWNCAHAMICLAGVAWGCLMYLKVDQLQCLHILLVSMIFIRMVSFFSNFKMTGYNLLYLGSVLCLVGITINSWSLSLLEIIFVGLNVLFLFYEVIQCLVNGKDYLLDVWNYVDLARCVMSIVWGCLIYNGVGNLHLHFVVTCLCFLRGFTFFSSFTMTRMFVRMVLEVVKDMYSFLVILAFSTLSFGMMYAVLAPNDEVDSASDAWAKSYSLLMGNFKIHNNFGVMEWVSITAASLVNVIIMLNLLISILGAAYGKAQESAKENDTLEMLRLVIEYESMFFWKRKHIESTVMIVCKAAQSDVEDEWTTRTTEIKKAIEDKLGKSDLKDGEKPEPGIEVKKDPMEAKIEAVESSQSAMKAKVESVEAKMESVEAKVDEILAALHALRAQH